MSFGKVYETTYFGDVKEDGWGKIYFKKAEKSYHYKLKVEKEKEKEKPKKKKK